jgi:hypothetical protein
VSLVNEAKIERDLILALKKLIKKFGACTAFAKYVVHSEKPADKMIDTRALSKIIDDLKGGFGFDPPWVASSDAIAETIVEKAKGPIDYNAFIRMMSMPAHACSF